MSRNAYFIVFAACVACSGAPTNSLDSPAEDTDVDATAGPKDAGSHGGKDATADHHSGGGQDDAAGDDATIPSGDDAMVEPVDDAAADDAGDTAVCPTKCSVAMPCCTKATSPFYKTCSSVFFCL